MGIHELLSRPPRLLIAAVLIALITHDATASHADPDLAYFAGDDQADTAVSMEGERFLICELPTQPGRTWNGLQIEGLLLNARLANGIYDDMDGDPPSDTHPWDRRLNTENYIANMPAWRSQGLAAFTS